jgi:hypothetical protein
MTATRSIEPDSICVVALPAPQSRAGAKRRRAYSRFKEALLAFSESPSTESVVRYLAASRELRPTGTGSPRGRDLPPAA